MCLNDGYRVVVHHDSRARIRRNVFLAAIMVTAFGNFSLPGASKAKKCTATPIQPADSPVLNHKRPSSSVHGTSEKCHKPPSWLFPRPILYGTCSRDGNRRELSRAGIRLVALRSAGFNNVDLEKARNLGLKVARVPAYSPHAVAEHTVALMLALNRKIHRAYNRVREGNFALNGLLGFDLSGKTVGIVGTGKIGAVLARILKGFGCDLIGNDIVPNPACEELGMVYVSREELFARADILSLHCPLTPDTHHMICSATLAQLKRGMMLINTSRGAVIETRAVIRGLKEGIIGSLGLDVYEEEADLFFEDLSNRLIRDDVFARLLTFPNVLITGHQAFFTQEALASIAETTIANITAFAKHGRALHEVSVEKIASKP